jgi:hypothetical protein
MTCCDNELNFDTKNQTRSDYIGKMCVLLRRILPVEVSYNYSRFNFMSKFSSLYKYKYKYNRYFYSALYK